MKDKIEIENKIVVLQKTLNDAITEIANLKQCLKDINETKDYTWESCFKGEGYYLNILIGDIGEKYNLGANRFNRNIAASEKVAKQMLAMAQLSHIIEYANEGWVADWNDHCQPKYAIVAPLSVIKSFSAIEFLAFKSEEIAEQVLSQNKDLIKQFYGIE